MADDAIHVLLIEDNQDDALILLRFLSRPGWPSFRFACRCAQTLSEGIEDLAKEGADIVLLDLILPDSRGIETVRRLRARAPDVPIVVLTGFADERWGLEAIVEGAQDYQVKGKADAQDIKKAVSYAVERYRAGAQLQGIFAGAAEGAIVLTHKNEVLYMNPAAEELLNIKASECLGRPFLYALPPQPSVEIKAPNKIPGNPDCIVEFRLSDIQWKGVAARLALARDVTGTRILEQLKTEIAERLRMDKLKDELMNSVAHEMRIPVTVVRTAIGLFKEGSGGPLNRKQEELIGLVDRGSARLKRILESMLDLSRLESGNAAFDPSQVSISSAIRDVAGDFRILAKDCGVEISEDIAQNLPSALVDADSLRHVLSNLIENALRFTDSRISLQACLVSSEIGNRRGHRGPQQPFSPLPPGEYIQISVIDDGEGIPRESREKLFVKFQQASRDPKRGDYKGTGLGLALCKEIIEQQGGKIWIDSEEGRGTAVHFVLPQFKGSLKPESSSLPSGFIPSGD